MQLPQLTDIPEALRGRNQWVIWKYEARKEGEKPTKVPYQSRWPQRKASSKGPGTWSDVETALKNAAKYGFDGIGYVFSSDDPFAGIDFDNILNADGSVAPWARPWLAELTTYAEVSPSGKGIKAIVQGKLPGNGVNAGQLELYDSGRYFAITGQKIEGAPLEPQPVNGALEKLYSHARALQEQQAHQLEYARREAYAQGALKNEVERVRTAPDGQRNTVLNKAAFSLAGFVASGLLDEQEVAEALADAASIAGLGAQEIRGTLRSGMKAGLERPRSVPEKKKGLNTSTGEISDGSTDWWAQGITLADLQVKSFPPLRWIIEDICPEGVTLVAAKPKSKKSWIALGLALSVALNRPALGKLAVDPGRVLFLDLEGNERRIQGRARAILGNASQPWPENFHVFTEWTKGDECISRLEQWFQVFPDTRVVVIDLLAEIRPPMDPKGDRYQYDRELLVLLNKLAERYGVAIIVIHHTRKAKGDDVFDEVSGTLGINGAVSTLWILSRAQDGHVVLSMTGRDLVHDEPLALRWDGYQCSFVIEGSASEVAIGEERRQVLELLSDDQAWTPKQIAADLGKSVGAIQQVLRDMLAAGQIDKAGYGKYSLIPSKSGKSGKSGTTSKSSKSSGDDSYSTLTDSYSTLTTPSKSLEAVPERTEGTFQANSYHSYHDSVGDDFWRPVPISQLATLRSYLRSQMPQDEDRARDLCEEYGLDYDEAKNRIS